MNFIRALLLGTLLSTGLLASLCAMELPKFNVAVLNSLGMPLQVEYIVRPNIKVTRIIAPGEAKVIGSEEVLLPGTVIVFSGYGTLRSFFVGTSGLFPDMLRSKWERVQKQKGDPLLIIVSSEGFVPPSALTFTFSHALPKATVKYYDNIRATNNPLAAFIRLNQYSLLEYLTKEQLLGLRHDQLYTILVPARLWELHPTTVEDVFRYILGLQKNYTQQDVENAYTNIEIEWDLENIKGEASQLFAQNVILLAKKAHEILLDAIKDRSLIEEWQLPKK